MVDGTTHAKRTTNTYRCYGLSVHSTFPIPALEPAENDAPPDILIRQGVVGRPLPEDLRTRGCYQATPQEALIYYEEVGQIAVREGREIVVDPAEELEEFMMHHIILGVSMGIAMHQRGFLTLHASGVDIDGGVAGFIGWKGMGKSTTAAALYARGHRLVTDDTIVLDPEQDTLVLPGTSQIRLHPDAVVASLKQDPDDIPQLKRNYEKRIGRADMNFTLEPVPLRHIYVLDWGEDIEIERLKAKNAFIQVLTHSYAQRFLKEIGATKRYFRQVEALVTQVPVYRLQKPVDIEQLPLVVDRIEEHMVGAGRQVSATG